MRQLSRYWIGSAALAAALACEQPAGQPATTASSQVDPAGDSSSGEPGDGATSAHDPSADMGADLQLQCDPFKQGGCSEGQKCNLYSKSGDGALDAAACVPLTVAPRQTAESCTVQGGYGTGLDDCAAGLMCWAVGPNGQGTCVPLCDGCSDDPQCPDGRVCAEGVGNYHYMCLPACDPVAQNCIEGDACILSGDGFVCAPDASGTEGQIYDDCVHANGCEPGMMCAPPGSAPGCTAPDALGCCVPFCLVGGTSCPDDLECVVLFDPAEQPELAEFGFCTAPP